MAKDPSENSKQLVDVIVDGLLDKKGLNVLFIDFTNTPNTVANYFVICHGSSSVHADALADGVIYKVKQETGSKPWNKEGMENAEWILLDYSDVVVHIFQEDTRRFYDLEGLWADMETTTLNSS